MDFKSFIRRRKAYIKSLAEENAFFFFEVVARVVGLNGYYGRTSRTGGMCWLYLFNTF